MFRGFAGLLLVALVAITALPEDLAAQKSARIRVSARVVSSVVPETIVAINQQLAWLARTDNNDMKELNQQRETAGRYAQVSTTHMVTSHESMADHTTSSTVSQTDGSDRLRITVAYTAN